MQETQWKLIGRGPEFFYCRLIWVIRPLLPSFYSLTSSYRYSSLLLQLEFLNNLWGLGTEEEWCCRTGLPGYICWRKRFLGIDSWAL